MILNTDEKQLNMVKLRARCGRWRKGRTWTEVKDREKHPNEDIRAWRVTIYTGDRRSSMSYTCNQHKAEAVLKSLMQLGYQLEKPQYPELKEFLTVNDFRSFEEVLADEIDVRRSNNTEPLTGLDFLKEMWSE